jgi:uncharacterized repeat protein (TIGR02543 family)
MWLASLGAILILSFLSAGTFAAAKTVETTSVAISKERPMVGVALSATIQNPDADVDYSYVWTVGGEEISCTKSYYIPTEADYENWIEVAVYDGSALVCQDQIYFSKLPVAYITTDDKEDITSRDVYKSASLRVQGNEKYAQQYDSTLQVRCRGNWSYIGMPKKSYRLKLDTKTDMFGFGKNKHWVMIANYREESLQRNTIANNISMKLGLTGADTTWVDVVINGEYVGNYQFCEQIRVDENRVNIDNWSDTIEDVAKAIYAVEKSNGMTKEDRDAMEDCMEEDFSWVTSGEVEYNGKTYTIADYYEKTFDISGGYLFELNRYQASTDGERDTSEFDTGNGMRVVIDSPEYTCTNDEMFAYCKDLWQSFEDMYCSEDGYSNGSHYSQIADVNSMVSYWLTLELVGNNDAAARSRWVYKDTGGLLTFGPVWDFDIGFGSSGVGSNATGWKFSTRSLTDNLFKEWIDDPYFLVKASEKYWDIHSYMESIYEDGGMVDEYYDYLKESGAANEAIWKWKRGFEEDTASVKTYLKQRMEWLDQQFATQKSIVSSLYTTNSSNPYTKSDDILQISLTNAEPDAVTPSEQAPADGLIVKSSDLAVTVAVSASASVTDATVATTASLSVYVNGLKEKEYEVKDGACSFVIAKEKLTEDLGTKNVISIIGRDSDGNKTYTNFVTVIQTDEYIPGTPYTYDGIKAAYDVDISHVVINQVYGGSDDGYASHSFIELYNPTEDDVDVSSWSVQYRSSAKGKNSTSWSKLDLEGKIPAHTSYLIRCGSVDNPEKTSVDLTEEEKYDIAWSQSLNNKGLSVVLMCNQTQINADNDVFDNVTKSPVAAGYVDMFAVSGNDGTEKQRALYYETAASAEQSKKKTLRRIGFQDTDDNSVGVDFEVVDYSFDNNAYISYISPKCTKDGIWEYNESQIPGYSVTYYTNGGSQVAAESYPYNTFPQQPETPVRTGYTFDGWYKDAAFTEEYQFNEKPTEDVELYAKWTVNQYTITFEGNGSASTPAAITADYGSVVSVPEEPEWDGYRFDGWYEDEELRNVYTFTKMPAKDITLFAAWTVNEYTIRFESNGGSDVSSITQKYGTEVTLSEQPTRTGYTFGGWFTDKKLTQEYVFGTMPARNLILYAKWDINQYTLKFVGGGMAAPEEMLINYGEEIAEPDDSDMEKEGCTFLGWYTDESLKTKYVFTTMPASDVILYAGWTVNEYTIRFESNGGNDVSAITQAYGTEVTEPDTPVKTGCTFAGWYANKKLTQSFTFATMPAGNITLYAKWDRNEYKITFEGNGSVSTPSAIVAAYGEEIAEPDVSDMKKTGCIFTGWYAEETLQNRYEFDTMPSENITLYAGWKQKEYLVTWTDYDGTVLKKETVSYGGHAEAPENPVRTGYRFIGWSSAGLDITANEVITAEYEKMTNASADDVTKDPAQDTDTSVVTKDPEQDTDTSVVTKDPIQDTDTSVVTKDPAQDTDTSVVTKDPAQEVDTSVVTKDPAQDTDTSVVTKDPAQDTDTSVITKDPEQDTDTSVATEDPVQNTNVSVTDENDSAVTNDTTENLETVVETVEKITKRTITIKATYKVSGKHKKQKKVTKTIKNHLTLQIPKCRSVRLTAVVKGERVPVKWISSNKKILSVSSGGKVKVKKAGTACIRAKVEGQVKKIKVVVKKSRLQ